MSYASVVIMYGGQILLQQRRNVIRNWSLIGGEIEPNEPPEQAAIRETREETGYEIEVERLVGIYNWPQMRPTSQTAHVYIAHIIGGKFAPTSETVQVKFFAPERLPLLLNRFSTSYVHDALQDVGPKMTTIIIPTWKAVALKMAIALLNHFEPRQKARYKK